MMDFSYPTYCSCHACGGPIHFTSLLSVVICPRCNRKNFPPAGENTPMAAPQPRFPIATCATCGSQTFNRAEDGSFFCAACGTPLPPTFFNAAAERKFNCIACHWELPIRGKQRVITCPACGKLNTMPELPEERNDFDIDLDFDL
ncbi:MAG: hypothetical protein IJE07_00430 [Clostridia bacterium]|nr:hypothetical protein [Clostridia bacterium]